MEGILVIVCVSAISSLIFGYVWVNILTYQRNFRLTEVESKVESLIQSKHQEKGVEKRLANQRSEEEFMLAAQKILAGEGEMKDKAMKVFMLNPGMALKLASKLGIKL